MNQQLICLEKGDPPPQDVGPADGAEGPEEDSGSRSNKELDNEEETSEKAGVNPVLLAEGNWSAPNHGLQYWS